MQYLLYITWDVNTMLSRSLLLTPCRGAPCRGTLPGARRRCHLPRPGTAAGLRKENARLQLAEQHKTCMLASDWLTWVT